MSNIFNEEWFDLLHNDSKPDGQQNKLRVYRKFKSRNILESYQINLKNPILRSEITKIRISAHKLGVEIGRMNKIIFNNRLCKFCSKEEVDDEYHFFENCTLNNSERLELYNDLMMEDYSFLSLMKSTDTAVQYRISKFIKNSNAKRTHCST